MDYAPAVTPSYGSAEVRSRRPRRRILAAGALVLAACGSSHAKTTPSASLAARGAGLVQVKPCLVCHTTSGGPAAGPTFAGLAGSQVELADGTTVTADDAYLERSILDPNAQTVAGYSRTLMATLVHPNSMSPRDAEAIVAYLHTLAPPASSK